MHYGKHIFFSKYLKKYSIPVQKMKLLGFEVGFK